MQLSPQYRLLLGLVACTVLYAAFSGAERACGEVKPLHLRAPDGHATATRYPGCERDAVNPHVLLRFRGEGEGREFVLADLVFVTRMRWLTADRLEIGYRTTRESVTHCERIVRAASDSVRVIYLGLPGRRR